MTYSSRLQPSFADAPLFVEFRLAFLRITWWAFLIEIAAPSEQSLLSRRYERFRSFFLFWPQRELP